MRKGYNSAARVERSDAVALTMTKRPPTALLLIVVLVCFVLGLIPVLTRNSKVPTPSPSTPQPSAAFQSPLNPNEQISHQTSILVLGVDQLQADQPALRAVWLIVFRPPGKEIFLYGLPLDAKIGGDESATLAALFEFSLENGLNPEFESGLHQFTPLEPDLLVLLDEFAFSSAIDFLNGVQIDETIIAGEQVIAFQSLMLDDPLSLLYTQSEILQALTSQAARLGTSLELTELIELVPEHAYVSQETVQALALVIPILPIDPDLIHINLVGIQKEP
jgi:hypothetical protein